MNLEAKVGAFTIAGLALLAAIIMVLSGFNFGGDKGFYFSIGFNQVIGLSPQSDVKLSGVNIGKVRTIRNTGGGVVIDVSINPGVQVPRDSKFSVASAGVMSSKFISIMPVSDDEGFLKNGEFVFGSEAAGIDGLFESVNKTLDKVQDLLVSVNDIMGNGDFKSSIIQTSINLREFTGNLNVMSASLARMAVDNENDVRQMVSNLSKMTASLSQAADTVNVMINDFAGDGQSAANLKQTVANIADASARIQHMAENLDGVIGDPETAEDLKATIHNARKLTDKADGMMSKVSSIKVDSGVDLMYSGKADQWKANMDFNVGTGEKDPYLRLGLDGIGDDNYVNAQVGKRFGSVGGRAGIVDSKLGVGVDAYAGKDFKFTAEAYNMNDASVKLRAEARVAKSTYVFGQVNDVNKRDKRATYVGIRQNF